jgi:hypothetical protein
VRKKVEFVKFVLVFTGMLAAVGKVSWLTVTAFIAFCILQVGLWNWPEERR